MNKPALSFRSPPRRKVDNFVAAAGSGNKTAVIEFLNKYPAALDKEGHGSITALKYAAQNGQDAIVGLLLERGAAIDFKGSDGWTALMEAVRAGSKPTVELLLQKGADINDNNYGLTVLIQAVSGGYSDITEILLEKGAPLDGRDVFGRTALMHAQLHRLDQIADLLVRWPEILEQRQAEKETQLAEELAVQRAQFLKDTDFSRGLEKPMPKPRPFNFSKPKL